MRVDIFRKDSWLAITAGIGSINFEEAAHRVANSIRVSSLIDEVVEVVTADIQVACPEVSHIYGKLMNVNTRGYGFMCWKAEIVHKAMEGFWGDFDGVVWIDAGCEVSINPFSQLKLRKFQKFAKKHGVACFTLDTLEIEYTKRDLFEKFPQIDPLIAGKQIQTTWFLLHGQKGKKIAREWFSTVVSGTNLLELTPSKNPEFANFIENRYDQSVFSLVCKTNEIPIMKYKPTNGYSSRLIRLRGLLNPIWTARNRFGLTIKRPYHQIVEKILITKN